MRHLLLTLGLLLACAVAVGVAVFHANCDRSTHAAMRDGDVLCWMQREFRLTAAQYAEIRRLHEEHTAACTGHCTEVRSARATLAEAVRAGDPAARAAAAQALERAEGTCRASVEAHVRRVAAAMDPAQGPRYLSLVLPRLAALDHDGPPNLRLTR